MSGKMFCIGTALIFVEDFYASQFLLLWGIAYVHYAGSFSDLIPLQIVRADGQSCQKNY